METGDFKDNLDYNDGLGDLLRKKEQLEFSWPKTLGILSLLIVFILFGAHVLFNMGKTLMISDDVIDLGKIVTQKESSISRKPHRSRNLSKLEPSTIQKRSIQESTFTKPNMQSSMSIASLESVKKETRSKQKGNKQTKQVWAYKVIIGTFHSRDNAILAMKKFKSQKIDAFIRISSRKGSRLYQVQAGAFKSLAEARTFKSKLAKKKIESYIIKV